MNLERISTSGGSFNKGQAEIRTIGKVLNWSTFEKLVEITRIFLM
jgi:alpha/beta superfamily hydrolase